MDLLAEENISQFSTSLSESVAQTRPIFNLDGSSEIVVSGIDGDK